MAKIVIKYHKREETIGFKEPPLLEIIRDGELSGVVYELKESYPLGEFSAHAPEDVYELIADRCGE